MNKEEEKKIYNTMRVVLVESYICMSNKLKPDSFSLSAIESLHNDLVFFFLTNIPKMNLLMIGSCRIAKWCDIDIWRSSTVNIKYRKLFHRINRKMN